MAEHYNLLAEAEDGHASLRRYLGQFRLDGPGLAHGGCDEAERPPSPPHRPARLPWSFSKWADGTVWRRFRLAPRTTRETYNRRSRNKNLPDGFFAWSPRYHNHPVIVFSVAFFGRHHVESAKSSRILPLSGERTSPQNGCSTETRSYHRMIAWRRRLRVPQS